MTTYLSKSDFKVARTCATKLYYRKLGYPSMLDEDEYLQFLADGGYMIETIAKICYPQGIEIGFDKGPEQSAAETMPDHCLIFAPCALCHITYLRSQAPFFVNLSTSGSRNLFATANPRTQAGRLVRRRI